MSVTVDIDAPPQDAVVVLSSEYVKKDAALAIPGAYWERDLGWCTNDTSPRTCSIIVAIFPELLADYPWLGHQRDKLYGSARPTDFATPYNQPLSWDALSHITPYHFQSIDTGYIAAQMKALGGAFIGWSRGLGKTMGTLAVAADADISRMLIVCGNTMKEPVWAAEAKNAWPDADVWVMPNVKAKREQFLADLQADYRTRKADAHPLVVVVHYEQLALIAGKKGMGTGWNKLGEWDLMVFDESHRLANTKTQMHKGAMRAGKMAKHRLALTGTAIMNKGDDLFGQLNWLYPVTYKSKWKDWNDRYLDYVRTGYGQVCVGFKPEKLDDLRRELGVFMVYRTKEDELDLPDRVVETRYIKLSAKQTKAYEDLRDKFWTELQDGTTVTAQNPLAQLNLLRRVATGLSAVEASVDDSTKLDYAVELIKDADPDEAFVVFSWYKAPLETLSQRLKGEGIGHFTITGDTPMRDRPDKVARFQAGEGRVFLGTLSTLGESVNLQRASSAIFLDRDWNPAKNSQAEDRIYRIGQERRVTITHLVAKGTVDELRVQPVLASKDALRKAIFGAK